MAESLKSIAMLILTSPYIKGSVHSKDSAKNVKTFLEQNGFSPVQQELTKTLFDEANRNNFTVEIRYSR
jgi:hypothetical protein